MLLNVTSLVNSNLHNSLKQMCQIRTAATSLVVAGRCSSRWNCMSGSKKKRCTNRVVKSIFCVTPEIAAIKILQKKKNVWITINFQLQQISALPSLSYFFFLSTWVAGYFHHLHVIQVKFPISFVFYTRRAHNLAEYQTNWAVKLEKSGFQKPCGARFLQVSVLTASILFFTNYN